MFDELSANGEAKAGSTEPPGNRGIGLCELLKQPFADAFRHADARISDFKSQGHNGTIRCLIREFNRDLNRYSAAFGEFYSVAQDVQKNLSQSGWIATISTPRLGVDKDGQINILFARASNHKSCRGFDRCDKIEVNHFQIELSRL